MTTEQAAQFLTQYYREIKRYDLSRAEQWAMLKKYKDSAGNTCRDFFNDIHNVKAIVVHNKESGTLSVIENKNFLFFLEQEEIKPLYVYAPFISNTGLNFQFALYKNLKEQKSLSLGGPKLIEVLLEKLREIFIGNGVESKDKEVLFIKDNMLLITNYDANLIIDKLEQNNFRFDSDIFNFFKHSLYQPVYPDALDLKYHFPHDEHKNSQQSMEAIFAVLSKQELSEENYTRVRKLVRRMSLEALNLSLKTALDLNPKERHKIERLYDIEIKRRKVKDFIS